MKTLHLLLSGATVLAAITFPAAASAAVVFSDDFADGNRTGWFNSSGTSSSASVVDGALTVTNGRHVLAYFGATSLTEVGDRISLSFDISFDTPAAQGSGFRVGLFNSNGITHVSADGVNTGFQNYLGYTVSLNLVPTNSPIIFRQRNNPGNTALITTTSDYTQIGDSGGSVTAFASTTIYHMVYTLEKTASDTVSLGLSVTGGSFADTYKATVADSVGVLSLFNSLAISTTSTTAASFTLDNVEVTFTPVPEPSAFAALAGLGVLGLAASRRRSRRA